MKKRWLWILGAVLVPVLGPCGYWVGVVNYTSYKAQKTILEYHVPANFSGWITIKFGVPEAEAIPFVPDGIGGTYTYRIPASGYLETRSPMYVGWHTDRYFLSSRGGAVLVAWVPEPFFLREGNTTNCSLIFVPVRALAPDQDPPPAPEHGCH